MRWPWCINEYFRYSREISADFVNATRQSDKIIAELWEVYLQYEYLGMDIGEEIKDILNTYTESGYVNEKYIK